MAVTRHGFICLVHAVVIVLEQHCSELRQYLFVASWVFLHNTIRRSACVDRHARSSWCNNLKGTNLRFILECKNRWTSTGSIGPDRVSLLSLSWLKGKANAHWSYLGLVRNPIMLILVILGVGFCTNRSFKLIHNVTEKDITKKTELLYSDFLNLLGNFLVMHEKLLISWVYKFGIKKKGDKISQGHMTQAQALKRNQWHKVVKVKFDYTKIADRLRTVSWSYFSRLTRVHSQFTGPTCIPVQQLSN